MISTSSSNFGRLTCEYCRNIYTNPHSLDCGHVFCLSPCILSFQADSGSIHCSSCGFASPIDTMKAEEKLGKEVRDFRLNNESVEISSCTTCQRPNCNVGELCKHCDRYLCHQCVTSHKAMYSSVLFSRLLDLQLRYKHYVDRRGEVKSESAGGATERLQQTIEGALLRAEICLESLEILLNDQCPEMSIKLGEIASLFGSSEGNCDLSKRLSKTASEIRNGYSGTSHNLPLNVQSFVNKYQKASTVSKREVSSSFENSRTSSLTRSITPTRSFNLLGQCDVTMPTTELSTSGTFRESASSPSLPNQPVSIGTWVRGRRVIIRKSLLNSTEPSSTGAINAEASKLIATCRCICVQGLSKRNSKNKSAVTPSANDLKSFFWKFGIVKKVLMKPPDSNGFVIFSNKMEAQIALSAPVHSVNGCFFKVLPAHQIPKTIE